PIRYFARARASSRSESLNVFSRGTPVVWGNSGFPPFGPPADQQPVRKPITKTNATPKPMRVLRMATPVVPGLSAAAQSIQCGCWALTPTPAPRPRRRGSRRGAGATLPSRSVTGPGLSDSAPPGSELPRPGYAPPPAALPTRDTAEYLLRAPGKYGNPRPREQWPGRVYRAADRRRGPGADSGPPPRPLSLPARDGPAVPAVATAGPPHPIPQAAAPRPRLAAEPAAH